MNPESYPTMNCSDEAMPKDDEANHAQYIEDAEEEGRDRVDEDEPVVQEISRRHRVRKRPSFQVRQRGRNIRTRSTKSEGDRSWLHGNNSSDSESDYATSTLSYSGYGSRDLSPVEHVREYLGDCAGEMVEDFERICQEVSHKMSSFKESASQKSNAFVKGSKNIVHRTAKGGASIVADAASKSGEMAKSAVAAAEKTAKSAAEMPGRVVEKIKHWKVSHFEKLPGWMRDNEYLRFGHRPELNSFTECFKSIFMIHTETGNIWTHLIGLIAFITITIIFYVKPLCDYCNMDIELGEKLIFLFFFIGAILCLGLSSLFHTVCCHSEIVSKLFCKLDYVGISLLTVGSFVPWIYYGFYCQFLPKVVYLTSISLLGILSIIVTMSDKFSSPSYRPARALLFVCLGGFGLVPAVHFLLQSGWAQAVKEASIHWVILMGGLYMVGAVLYGARIPERFLPGKCDIWFQSHQIFHVLVIAAAFVHYHGISNMAVHRLTKAGECKYDAHVIV